MLDWAALESTFDWPSEETRSAGGGRSRPLLLALALPDQAVELVVLAAELRGRLLGRGVAGAMARADSVAVRVASLPVAAHHPDHHQRAGEDQGDEEQLSHDCRRSVGARFASFTATWTVAATAATQKIITKLIQAQSHPLIQPCITGLLLLTPEVSPSAPVPTSGTPAYPVGITTDLCGAASVYASAGANPFTLTAGRAFGTDERIAWPR